MRRYGSLINIYPSGLCYHAILSSQAAGLCSIWWNDYPVGTFSTESLSVELDNIHSMLVNPAEAALESQSEVISSYDSLASQFSVWKLNK